MSTQDHIMHAQGLMTEAENSVKLAITKLYDAKKINDTMQKKHEQGAPDWHMHESIDDRIHEALSALGD